ncbi:TetR/AcrR family transcriptional regulator [Nocardia cyriacigeorgica]|uniref:TetR/AcrR family transcriptional regulator n=1 Tax=Nocardia cyriacigeorgica TaxID=135487 RepID=UPI002453DF17|nr:TetR/AcrR family transcriptional regulator [Nocardia cyriacigeorgica]
MASTETSGSGDLGRTLELLWETGPRPSRGPKPGLTLDRIVEAAVQVADAEGLEAVTMRRVATELGTGTMTLYRYLPGKSELLDLMLDRVQRPDPDLGAAEGGWRGALERVARGTLALYRRHPWLLHVNQARPILGPAAIESMETVLSAITPMGLSDVELISVIVLVDNYVVGAARSEVFHQEALRTTGMTDADFWQAQIPTIERALATGRFPTMAELDENAFDQEFDHFGFGLRRILDGLEGLVAERARGRPGAR